MIIIKRFAAGAVVLAVINFLMFNPFLSCNDSQSKASYTGVPLSGIKDGRVLAQQYCQSCHLLPDPSLLSAAAWKTGVLPVMGPYLGIFNHGFNMYPNRKRDRDLPADFYPSSPVLNPDQWQSILDYYTATAPDTLISNNKGVPAIKNNLPFFAVEMPSFPHKDPATTFISADSSKTGGLMYYDASAQMLYRCTKNLELYDSLKTRAPIVDVKKDRAKWLLCNIGIMVPNNGKSGKVQYATLTGKNRLQLDTAAELKDLQRPVQVEAADLDNDGKTDYLVCEFGFMTGSLSWMKNKGDGTFERQVLRSVPGAIKAYIDDYNKDGLPDIWVLFTQGAEGIFLYTNLGHGKFKEEAVLRFPPVYGSTYFEFADFNRDGYKDIIYTCGDNADFSPILKPYHGVYIYLNDGANHFTQKYFYPINGCFKAMARDFDGDGDLDIAAISHFADYTNKPEEGFVYLENKGNFNFTPYSAPETQKGRWLTMDVGDVDGDGKADIILGNFSVRPSKMKSRFDWKKGPPFLVLKNKSR